MKRTKTVLKAASFAILIALFALESAHGQSLTQEETAFAAQVGVGDYAYSINEILANEMGMLPGGSWRVTGSDADHEAADWIEAEMERLGLVNVAKDPFPVHTWSEFQGAFVTISYGETQENIAASPDTPAPGTPPGGITGDLVYVGFGRRQDYVGKDVAGKIVLVDWSWATSVAIPFLTYEAQLHGAVGMITHFLQEQSYLEGALFSFPYMVLSGGSVPSVYISHKDVNHLKSLLTEGPVQANMKIDATVDDNGTSYNVVGYIPGTTHPDELIIIGDHYDKYFYGASDNSSGTAIPLAIAEALLNSGYTPSRTFVFVAHSAEETGADYEDNFFPCDNGAYYEIAANHPEWVGRTLAYFNFEDGGQMGATSISASGGLLNPEMDSFARTLLPLFDSYFSNNPPWSEYYYPSSAPPPSLVSVRTDSFPYSAAGVPNLAFRSSRNQPPLPGVYHGQYDTMDYISAESLAMSVIANGIAAIRLDSSDIAPYNFTAWTNLLRGRVNEAAITGAGLDPTTILEKIQKFDLVASRMWNLWTSGSGSKQEAKVNAFLMRAAKIVSSKLQFIGGDLPLITLFPHEQYQRDSMFLRNAIGALTQGNVDAALASLQYVTFMYYAGNLSYPVVEALTQINADRYFTGRLATVTDVWQEFFSLLQKKAAGDTDYSSEIASLTSKYEVAVVNLETSLEAMTAALSQATAMLTAAEANMK